ncbi:MAG: hypothetical protein KKH72_05905 [Alphaproteobacteria bacterium]|nr:hypothetical protein [Alphaproteobacteria bacterium]
MPYSLSALSPEILKVEARVLREECASSGETISHSEALERTAKAHGYRDWNTAVAALPVPMTCPVALGDRVSGTYLKQRFAGRVIATAILAGEQLYKVTIKFDEPVDVVTFDSFSAFRQRVTATVDAYGVSPAHTSDGEPHMRLDPKRADKRKDRR